MYLNLMSCYRIGSDSIFSHRRNLSQSSNTSNDAFAVNGPSVLSADVVEFQLVKDSGKPFAVYKIVVRRRDPRGNEDVWTLLRRYSDFYALHDQVSCKFPHLAKLTFPQKKTFGNLDSQVLQKRLNLLHCYLQVWV